MAYGYINVKAKCDRAYFTVGRIKYNSKYNNVEHKKKKYLLLPTFKSKIREKKIRKLYSLKL